MRKAVLMIAVLWAAPMRDVAADDVFDVPVLTSTPLKAKVLKRNIHDGLVTEEVKFHSERDGETDVDIFAFFSYPKDARDKPAYIWNPGGLGQANPGYTEAGARRGYATLCIDFPQKGYRSTGNYDITLGLVLDGEPRQAAIYHGAVALLKAVSFLESRPEVDKNRIGMAGSSWGGFFTTLMVGIDPRLKVGSCLYGSGNLQMGNAWWDGDSLNGRQPPSPDGRDRWRATLDPALRLPTKKTPIAWFTGTNDGFYFLPGVVTTYDMVPGPKHLCLVPNWDHALPQKLHDESVMAWLDTHLQGKPGPVQVSPTTVWKDGERLVVDWDFTGDAVSADLIASYGDPGNWRGRYWHTVTARIDGRTCRAELPPAKLPCLISGTVVDKNGLRSSTTLRRVIAADLGVATDALVPDYDGCQEWGGFEPAQIAFLERHNSSGQTRWIPKLSRDAKHGAHSAVLNPERTALPPILSTAGVPHHLSAFLKAKAPVEVTVQLAGEQKKFKVGSSWTEIGMDYTPPNALMGGIPASITIPKEASVLLDWVRFRPQR